MISLTQKGVDIFIARHKSANQKSYWENYDLVIWKQNINGYTSLNGLFKDNTWGIADRVSVDNKGLWKISNKYVKYFK